MEADFSGYATKAGLTCSDGRTITPDAFRHQDKVTVPLVWQHGHDSPENVLGHAVLEAREDGIYAYGLFNDTPQGTNAKKLVQHEDIKSLSIYANQLVEKSKKVLHGTIRELSLVLSGANPGAIIDYVRVAHSDGEVEVLEDEAVIYTGLTLEHENLEDETVEETDEDEEDLEHADSDPTVQEVYDSLTDQQKEVVNYMIGAAIEAAGQSDTSAQHSALGPDATPKEFYDALTDEQKQAVDSMIGTAVEEAGANAAHSATNNQEGNAMTNVFEQNGVKKETPSLSHDQLKTIVDDANRLGSLKESFLAHVAEYGIEDIDVLFPDARADGNGVSLISRRMDWVQNVLTNTKHSPFSRIKSVAADITADEARARGYVKGNLKKDEIIKMLKRVTTPKTVYKKQKLDRDDIVDIVDIDVVAWLKAEMRLMLDEEIAGAILVGDGRDADDEDKIDEDHIRPIAYDVDMYAPKVTLGSGNTPSQTIEAIIRARNLYKGTGTPTLYTTNAFLTDLLLDKDTLGRRFYNSKQELAAALNVSDIVEVEVMERTADVAAILVNLVDYTVGADAGGNISMFDDFDIDYNQQKYLIETRISGALTKPASAVVVQNAPGTSVTPTQPTYNAGTHVITIPAVTGVVYSANGEDLASGAQPAITETTEVEARPAEGYSFPHTADHYWTFVY